MEIDFNGLTYSTHRLGEEPNEHLAKRLWFLIKLHPMNGHEYLEAERLSRIWYGMNYLGCRYPTELEEQIYDIVESFEKVN